MLAKSASLAVDTAAPGVVIGVLTSFFASIVSAKVGTFVNIIAYLGYAVALGMLAYIAMKYMMSAASDRANMKQGAINYLIGAFLIAGASTIATAVVSIVAGSKGADGIAGDIIGAGFGAGNP